MTNPFNRFLVPIKSTIFKFSHIKDSKELVVTFESAQDDIDRSNILRMGFGEKFLLDHEYSVLSLLPLRLHWYRPWEIRTFLKSVELQDYLKQFDKIHTYGSSMGALGAANFADLLGAKNVITIAPLSTLSAELVPWEQRFRFGAKQNWNGVYGDATYGVKNVASMWALFDENTDDAKHAARFELILKEKLKTLIVPNVGHGVTNSLAKAKLLKKVVLHCLQNQEVDNIQNDIFAQFDPLRIK